MKKIYRVAEKENWEEWVTTHWVWDAKYLRGQEWDRISMVLCEPEDIDYAVELCQTNRVEWSKVLYEILNQSKVTHYPN